MGCESVKLFAEIGAHLATAGAAGGAAWWFFFSGSFRKRIEFDVSCRAFIDPQQQAARLLELIFTIENKGQVENRCYTLAYEVESVEYATKEGSPALLIRSGNYVTPEAQFYYVRAGVAMEVTARHWIARNFSVVRVKAFILFDKKRHEISTQEPLFKEMHRFDNWKVVDRV